MYMAESLHMGRIMLHVYGRESYIWVGLCYMYMAESLHMGRIRESTYG